MASLLAMINQNPHGPVNKAVLEDIQKGDIPEIGAACNMLKHCLN